MRRGRPLKSEADRKSIQIGVRVTPALHGQLKAASKEANRMVSQEIEARLRLSFQEEERAWHRFGNRTTYWLFQQAAQWIAVHESPTGKRWWEDAELFSRCRGLVLTMLDALKPRGRLDAARRAEAEKRGAAFGELAIGNLELILRHPGAGAILGGPYADIAAGPIAAKLPQSAIAEAAAHIARTATIPELRQAAKRRARELKKSLQ